jgi:hypothetical protein
MIRKITMARIRIPMPKVLASEALVDRAKRSKIPTLLLRAFEDCGVFVRNLLAREGLGETS